MNRSELGKSQCISHNGNKAHAKENDSLDEQGG